MNNLHYDGPITLVVLDGVGLRDDEYGNAVLQSHSEFIDQLFEKYPWVSLKASGEAVGILKGQMGNSEVGHNALGAGQIIKQGIAKIEDDFKTGAIWQTEAWRGAIENAKNHNSTLHFSGIFSDGGVHSSLDQLLKMLEQAKNEGITKIRIHLILDGRDVPPQSADTFVKLLEDKIDELKKQAEFPLDYRIACGGGRMLFLADRYEADWNIVRTGWNAMVYGKSDQYFTSAMQAIEENRKLSPGLQDQYFPSFVITEPDANGQADPTRPVGLVQDGDSFIFYSFRADRAIETAKAFTEQDFHGFDRGTENNRPLNVFFAGMTEYDSDLHIPEHCLVTPITIKNPLNQLLAAYHINQLAVAETVKFGHITYYFNGNSYDKAEGEDFIEIKSDTQPFNERPWMKAAEITDAVLEKMSEVDESGKPKYQFIRINYAGGDMVGHFGELEPTITAMEAIDIQLARLAKKTDELGGMMIITADHGNAEEVSDPVTKKPKTSHTTNPVPCWFYDNTKNAALYQPKQLEDAGLSNVAPTIAKLFGISDLPESWRQPLI